MPVEHPISHAQNIIDHETLFDDSARIVYGIIQAGKLQPPASFKNSIAART